MLILVY